MNPKAVVFYSLSNACFSALISFYYNNPIKRVPARTGQNVLSKSPSVFPLT